MDKRRRAWGSNRWNQKEKTRAVAAHGSRRGRLLERRSSLGSPLNQVVPSNRACPGADPGGRLRRSADRSPNRPGLPATVSANRAGACGVRGEDRACSSGEPVVRGPDPRRTPCPARARPLTARATEVRRPTLRRAPGPHFRAAFTCDPASRQPVLRLAAWDVVQATGRARTGQW